MGSWITVAIIACAIARGDNNIPASQREEVARVEAQAFLDAASSRVSLLTLLAVARVETRFNPTGSQSDREHGWWGVMQLSAPELRCWSQPRQVEWFDRHHRRHVRYVRHDDPSRCTEEQTRERALLLDPAVNIARGARLLARRYDQIHAQQHDASMYRDWVGAYFWGSAPPPHGHRSLWVRVRAYAVRVEDARGIMRHHLEVCRQSVR